jgi:hypothetical protein
MRLQERKGNCNRKYNLQKDEKQGGLSMELTYIKCGDYYIPNLLPNPEPEGFIGKYGIMRESYLKEHRRGIYQGMLLSGELKEHLLKVQEQAELRFDTLVEQMARIEGVTEQLKEENQMLWVQKMNSIRDRADEIIRDEIIYRL